MRKEKKIKIGISIGDLNGIGGELIVRTFSDNRLLEFCTPVVFASTKIMSFLKKLCYENFKNVIFFEYSIISMIK